MRIAARAGEQAVDYVELAVVQSALVGVAREMGTIMERASYSSILNEGKDFSCAVFNRDGELVAEGEFVLVHLAAMHEGVQALMRRFADEWKPGHIAIHNDPYDGGSHLPDINLVRPVFHGGEVIAYVATRAHYPDVGGSVPGSFSGEARSLYDEGVVIPPLLLAREDELDEQLVALWARNVRAPRRLRADLLAQVASVRVGQRSLLDVCDRFGVETVESVLAAIPDYGERVMRSRIETLLSGSSEFFDYMDDAGPETSPVRLALAVRVDDSELEFDYRRSDPQVACPVNAPLAVVKSATFGAVKCLLAPELPLNSGMFRPMRVRTTPGTVTHPLPPAPVAGGNTNTSQRLLDMCLACLGELTNGGTGGMAGSYSANSDLGIGGRDDRTGEEFVLYMMPVGGIGARPELDGESSLINYMGNCSSQPVEVWESMYPLRVGRYHLRAGSAGAGRRRGGFGLSLCYEALQDDIELSVFTERQRFAPFGLRLGQPALPGSYSMVREGVRYELPTKTSGLMLRKGDVLEVETAGGGGYGDPFAREPELVLADVLQGLVSPEEAARDYGVIVTAGKIDHEATAVLRGEARRPAWVARRLDSVTAARDPSVFLSRELAQSVGAAEGDVLYCFSQRWGIYARAAVAGSGRLGVSEDVARVLGVGPGDELGLRPLGTSWLPHTVSAIKRAFGSARRTPYEREE